MIMSDTAKTLRLYSYNSDGRYLGLPARYCGAIEQMPGVLGCTPMVFVRATYRDERETIQAYALDADKVATMYPDYKIPREILERFRRSRVAAIAGKLLMRTHHWHTGDTITFRTDSNRLQMQFLLVGEIPSNNYPNFFMFHRDYLIEAEKAIGIPEEKHPPGFLVTRLDSSTMIAPTIREIDLTFHNSESETATMTESEAVSGLLSTVGDIRTIVFSIFVLIVLTVALISGNSLAIVLRDRLADAAVLRMLGFGPLYAAFVLLGEGMLLGITGALIGAALTISQFGGGTTLGGVLDRAGYLTITTGAVLQAVGIVGLVSLVSSIFIALPALRLTPADSFRRTSR